ncbi:DUF6196 family protein [Lysobacter firmicutimachus]|uniref:DUF6196 family protein n=1 Tax=Lysobacter firmicutimachus TaxID=1792846 RepID=A0AAU8MP13_9GAMM|nr:DUF6196 family protein [Lysobacter antibioticus]
MVDISHESPQATERRLLEVTRRARLAVYPGTYAFAEFGLRDFPAAVRADALALVRDDAVWSQLVPCDDPGEELFALFRFHFPAGADNSGFVGWLASRLKQRFGTGVFVTCGHNRGDGGIYDYWGVPAALAAEVRAELEVLTSPP